jgi:hypothetical protein
MIPWMCNATDCCSNGWGYCILDKLDSSIFIVVNVHINKTSSYKNSMFRYYYSENEISEQNF